MTLPNGLSGITEAIGTLFATTGAPGVIAGWAYSPISQLNNLTQSFVTNLLKFNLIQFSAGWLGATEAVWAGLRRGNPILGAVTLPLAIVEVLVSSILGLPPGTWDSVNNALTAIEDFPPIAFIIQLLTNVYDSVDFTGMLTTWTNNVHAFWNHIDMNNPLLSMPSALATWISLTLPGWDASKIISGIISSTFIPWAASIDALMNAWGIPGSGHTLTDLAERASNLPYEVVQGIQSMGNIGLSLEASIDSAVRGFTSATGAGFSFADLANSAAQFVGWAGFRPGAPPPPATIAHTAIKSSETLADFAISKPGTAGIDPSADCTFDLLHSMPLTAPTYVNVSQGNSVMSAIDTPNGGIKESIAWLGQTTTNITAAYIIVWRVDRVTGALSHVWDSNNIVATISNPFNWNFANIDVAAYIKATQGETYVAELDVRGTGTYQIVGMTGHWLPAHPSSYPKQRGLTRQTLLFDSVGAGRILAASAVTGDGHCDASQTIDSDSTYAVLNVAFIKTSGGSSPAFTAKIGSTPMTLANTNSFTVSGVPCTQLTYVLAHPPTGAQTVRFDQTTTSGVTWYCSISCESYIGPTGHGTIQAVSGTTSSGSLTCTSGAAGGLTIFNMCTTGSTFSTTGASLTFRDVSSDISTGFPLAVGDINGSSSVTAGVTGSGGTLSGWGIVGIPLTIGVPTTVANPGVVGSGQLCTYSTDIPWFSLTGTAGLPHIAPQQTPFTSEAGTFTYTLPAGVIEGDKFDVVISGAGGGGGGGVPPWSGRAGLPGSWNATTLEYGTEIPLGTTTLSVTVGTGGAAGPTNGLGGAGSATTVTVPVWGTLTAAGGAGSPGIFGGSATTAGEAGVDPGDLTYNATNYIGGFPTWPGWWPSINGNPSGGSGAGGPGANAWHGPDYSGGAGAIGGAWITYYR